MDATTIERAAEFCVKSYEPDESFTSDQDHGWSLTATRVVNLYKVSNEIKALVIAQNSESGGQVYVVFRGTVMTMIGNWMFANMQLFKAKYFGCPLEGTVHMGFYRGFHWLWHGGGEPKCDPGDNLLRWCAFFCRHLLIAAWIGAYGYVAWRCLQLPSPYPLVAGVTIIPILLIPLALWAGLVFWEIGTLENLFKNKAPDEGKPLFQYLPDWDRFDEVIFTGHSLGGAMATVAFAEFQKQSTKKTGRLITFGAPRLGDEACMKEFEANTNHHGRYLHVINRGDPVPEVPGTLRDARALNDAGWMAKILTAVGCLRRIWAFMYRQKPPGRWTEPADTAKSGNGVPLIRVGQRPLDFKNHKMETYKSEVGRVV